MNNRGMTLIEVIVVLLVMGIISAVAVNRFWAAGAVEDDAAEDVVRSHIRYAQAMAMKQNRFFWGIKCDGSDYWLFRTDNETDATEPDNNLLFLPGESAQKVTSPAMAAFTVYFDRFGKPRVYDANAGRTVPITGDLVIAIGGDSIRISPETGFVS